jgi:ATP-dependent Clp protease ATP-binding subunit ClpA
LAIRFFNRLDETVVMNGFDDRTAREVTGLEIDVVTRRLARRSVDVGPDVVALLCARGFDPVYRARGLRRTVRTALTDPIAAAVFEHRPVGTEPLALTTRVVDGRVRVTCV